MSMLTGDAMTSKDNSSSVNSTFSYMLPGQTANKSTKMPEGSTTAGSGSGSGREETSHSEKGDN